MASAPPADSSAQARASTASSQGRVGIWPFSQLQVGPFHPIKIDRSDEIPKFPTDFFQLHSEIRKKNKDPTPRAGSRGLAQLGIWPSLETPAQALLLGLGIPRLLGLGNSQPPGPWEFPGSGLGSASTSAKLQSFRERRILRLSQRLQAK